MWVVEEPRANRLSGKHYFLFLDGPGAKRAFARLGPEEAGDAAADEANPGQGDAHVWLIRFGEEPGDSGLGVVRFAEPAEPADDDGVAQMTLRTLGNTPRAGITLPVRAERGHAGASRLLFLPSREGGRTIAAYGPYVSVFRDTLESTTGEPPTGSLRRLQIRAGALDPGNAAEIAGWWEQVSHPWRQVVVAQLRVIHEPDMTQYATELLAGDALARFRAMDPGRAQWVMDRRVVSAPTGPDGLAMLFLRSGNGWTHLTPFASELAHDRVVQALGEPTAKPLD
ncbi:MAG: hypothetical protein AAF288_05840 [Planctomycetota bacterium]